MRKTSSKVLVAVALAAALVMPGAVAPVSAAPNNNNPKKLLA